MKTSFVWYTFTNDGGCCLQSVGSVLDLGVSPEDCTVFVQRGKPLHAKDVGGFDVLGVKIVEGRYARKDTFFDTVAKFRSISSVKGEIVWGVDSDVVINDLSPSKEVFDGGYVAGAAHWKGCEFSGCSNMIRPEIAEACLRDLLEKNTPKLPAKGVPDDVMMGMTLDALYGEDKVLRWPASVLGWYLFDRDWEKMAKAKWVHFGQKKQAQPFARGVPVRQAIASHMKEYREWRTATSR